MNTGHNDFTLYVCDPEKNTKCKKTSCRDTCFLTTRKEFAKTDKNGQPIKAGKDLWPF